MRVPEELRDKLRHARSLIDSFAHSHVRPGMTIEWAGGCYHGRQAFVHRVSWDEVDWLVLVTVATRNAKDDGWMKIHRKRYPLSCFSPIRQTIDLPMPKASMVQLDGR